MAARTVDAAATRYRSFVVSAVNVRTHYRLLDCDKQANSWAIPRMSLLKSPSGPKASRRKADGVESLRQEEVARESDIHRDPHAPEGVESLREGESRNSPLRGSGPATVDSPRLVTAIRVATLDRDDGRQGRGLPLLHGHRPLPQVQWHGDACYPKKGSEVNAPRSLHGLWRLWPL